MYTLRCGLLDAMHDDIDLDGVLPWQSQEKTARVLELEGSLAFLKAQHLSLAEDANVRDAQVDVWSACLVMLTLL
jgi:hypothetical protein